VRVSSCGSELPLPATQRRQAMRWTAGGLVNGLGEAGWDNGGVRRGAHGGKRKKGCAVSAGRPGKTVAARSPPN